MIFTPPCGRRALADRWASDCSIATSATTITIAAACGAIHIPKPPATKAGDKASAADCASGRRRHRRDPRQRRRECLRVRLPLARRRILVRTGFRPRFRRQYQAIDHPHSLQRRTANATQFPALRLRLGLPLLAWDSVSTTAATTCMKAPSWARAWPGIVPWACSAISAATITTWPPAG